MSGNAILTCVKLAYNHAILAERTTDGLRDLAESAIGVELLADCAGGGEDRWVLFGVSKCYWKTDLDHGEIVKCASNSYDGK